MDYLKMGISKIYLNNEYLGFTLRNKDVSFKASTISEEIKNDVKSNVIDKIIKGRNINIAASIPFTEENYIKFPTGKIISGELKITSCDDLFQIIIPQAEITAQHNNDYKESTEMSIDIAVTALQDISGNDVQLISLFTEVTEIEEYMQLGYIEGGILNEQTSLLSNYVYLADDGLKYLNTGGDRDWTVGNGEIDTEFIPCTLEYILDNWFTLDGGTINGDVTADSFNTYGGNYPRSQDTTTLGATEERTIEREILDANGYIRGTYSLDIDFLDEESFRIDIRDNTGALTNSLELNRDGLFIDGSQVAETAETEKYVQLEYTYGGLLNEQLSLLENNVYLADDGIKYFNIGGDRSWTYGIGTPDIYFIPATLKYVFDNWITQYGGIIDGELTANKFLTVGGNTTRISHSTNIDNTSLRNISEEITDNDSYIRLYKNLEITALDEESYTIDIRDETGTTTKQLKIARDGIYIDGYKIKKIDDFDYDLEENLTITDTAETIVNSITHYFEEGVYQISLSATYSFPDNNDYFQTTTYFDSSPVVISRITPTTTNEVETISNFQLYEFTTAGTHTFEIGMILSPSGTPATLIRSAFSIDWKKEI